MEEAKPRSRRRHDKHLKREVMSQCAEPGASVAQVAMAHGLNANLVHKWRREAQAGDRVPVAPALIPLSVASIPEQASQVIELDLQRGALNVRVRWPVEGASACAAWLREILR